MEVWKYGRLEVEYKSIGVKSADNWQQQTANRQPPTDNSQPSSVIGHREHMKSK